MSAAPVPEPVDPIALTNPLARSLSLSAAVMKVAHGLTITRFGSSRRAVDFALEDFGIDDRAGWQNRDGIWGENCGRQLAQRMGDM